MSESKLPVGLTMALSRNQRAMTHFASMTEYEKNAVIQWARTLHSRQEMEQLVSNIAGGNVQNFHAAGTNRNITQ